MFEKFNHSMPFASLDLDLTEITDVITLKELYELNKPVTVMAIMFSSKGEYGRSAFIIGRGDDEKMFTMWLPQHMTEMCDAILEDKEAVASILDGKCGIKARKYVDKKGKTRFSGEWVDLK